MKKSKFNNRLKKDDKCRSVSIVSKKNPSHTKSSIFQAQNDDVALTRRLNRHVACMPHLNALDSE